MTCECCGQKIREKKIIVRENIIEKWLKSNDKITWEYGTGFMKSCKDKPFVNANNEIKIGDFWFETLCWYDKYNDVIKGHIYVRTKYYSNGKKYRIGIMSLDNMNDITTDIVWNMIQNWIKVFRTDMLCKLDNISEAI